MKKLILAAPILLSLASFAVAQTPAPTKIGVIQVQAALANTKDGQAALDEMDKKLLQPRRKEIEGRQAELKDMQDRLQRGGNTMSQSAKDDLARQIDQRTKSLNRDMEDAQAELEAEQQKIVQGLLAKMQPIVEKYAQENGFSVILDVSNPNSGVFWAAGAADVTTAIVELYDKTAPATAPAKPATSAVKPATPAVKPPAAAPKPAPAK